MLKVGGPLICSCQPGSHGSNNSGACNCYSSQLYDGRTLTSLVFKSPLARYIQHSHVYMVRNLQVKLCQEWVFKGLYLKIRGGSKSFFVCLGADPEKKEGGGGGGGTELRIETDLTWCP